MNKETKKLFEELGVNDEPVSEKDELESLRKDKTTKANLEKELEILKRLFPELTVEDIPDQVFEECTDGKGLAAYYALFYMTSEMEKEDMRKKNDENHRSAPPEIKESEEDTFFTPEAVRAMSDKDVRRHYKAIMSSMEKWK